jgi:hypothetical protein
MNIFVAPFLFVFWCMLMFFINFANIIIRLFTNLKWLFSTHENSTNASLFTNPIGYFTNMFTSSSLEDEIYNNDRPKNWKPGSILSGMNIFTTIIYVILIILFTIFAGFAFVYPFISVVTIIYCFALPLFMQANDVKTYNKPTKYGFKNAIADVLKYKSKLIMLIVSYYIISGANTYFGNTVTAISFVIFLIMYFFTPLFESYKLNYKDNLTPGIIPEAVATPIHIPVVEAEVTSNVPEFSVDETNKLTDNKDLPVVTSENNIDKQILSGGKKVRS